MNSRSAVLNDHKYLHLLDLVNNRRLLFGFGRTSPWQIDLTPDPIPSYVYSQYECFGYVKATARAVIEVEEPTTDTVTVNDHYFLPVESSLVSLRENQCGTLLFEGTFIHNDITEIVPAKYRSVGLYRDAVFIPGNTDTSTFIPLSKVAAKLFYLRSNSPINITPNVEESIKEVVVF